MVLDGTNLAGFQLLIPFDFILLPFSFIFALRGVFVISLIDVIFFKKRLIFFVVLEHHGLILSADGSSSIFVDDVSVATHSSIVFVGYKFSVKLIVKKVEYIEVFIVTIVNYSLFVFIINVYDHRLFTQNAQFNALFQQAFGPFNISTISTVVIRDLLHYFIFTLAHVVFLLVLF